MIGKAQAAEQPSIDELLASIRKAIHERVEPAAPAPSPRLVHTTPAARCDGAQAGPLAVAGQEGFAGLLGGDVRLEEALARLHQSGWRRDTETPDAPMAAAPNAAAAAESRGEPSLRPTIAAWSERLDSPVPPAGSAKTRPSPARPSAVRQAAVRPAPAPAPAPRQREPMCSPAPAAYPPPAGDRASDLLSSEAARAANSAFGRLADAMADHAAESERTLDEITLDCLRPLLKGWLDKNLPTLVERLVREEIARVARPRR